MLRSRLAAAVLLSAVTFVAVSGPGAATALAPQPTRPRVKGRTHRIKVVSSPPEAAVYWDAGPSANPKSYGLAGYTPLSLKVPRGPVTIIVELQGFKPQQQALDIKKSQTVSFV